MHELNLVLIKQGYQCGGGFSRAVFNKTEFNKAGFNRAGFVSAEGVLDCSKFDELPLANMDDHNCRFYH